MTLTEVRALLKAAGRKTTASIDRLDVKYLHGTAVGVDVMFTDGDMAYLPLTDD